MIRIIGKWAKKQAHKNAFQYDAYRPLQYEVTMNDSASKQWQVQIEEKVSNSEEITR